MRTNSATERDGSSQPPTQPIAYAYFNPKPVAIDHYLSPEQSDRFFLLAVAATLIAAAVLLLLD
jgi:hypothetical protein